MIVQPGQNKELNKEFCSMLYLPNVVLGKPAGPDSANNVAPLHNLTLN